MDNHLRVAYATDENYVPITGISMLSLFDHNQSFEDITVYILDNGIQPKGREDLNSIARQYDREIVFLDCTNLDSWLGEKVIRMFQTSKTNVPIASYARLYLSQLLPAEIGKVLYLDADSIILGDYHALWNLDCTKYAAMGVLDNVGRDAREKIGLPPESNYINAGMVLFNLELLRKIEFSKLVSNFIERYDGCVYHHDQGVINGILHDRIGILPPEYNMLSFVYDHKSVSDTAFLYEIPQYYSQKEMEEAKVNPVFIHFTEGYLQRPWVKNCVHPLCEKWLEYKSKTVWKDMPVQADNRSMKLKLLSWMNLNFPVVCTKKIIEIVSK